MIKSLLVFISLLLWSTIGGAMPCAVLALYILLISAFLTISLTEMRIVKNSVIADSIFHSDTFIFSIVKSTKFTLLLSLFFSFFVATAMLVWLLHVDYVMLSILGVDVWVIWILYAYTKRLLSSRVKEEFLDAVSRRWASWINTTLLMLATVAYQLFVTPAVSVEPAVCEILEFVSSTLGQQDMLERRAASVVMGSLDGSSSLLGWILYLIATQSLFAWAYSKLLLSVDASTKNRNYFAMGFVGAIVILLLSATVTEYLYEDYRLKKSQIYVNQVYHEIDSRIDYQLGVGEQKVIEDIDEIVDKEIEIAFESVYGGIPALSEYYYSIKGEYMRLALKGRDLYCSYKNSTLLPFYNKLLPKGYQLEKCDERMLDAEIAHRVNSYLFVDSNFSTDIDRASIDINRAIQSTISSFHAELNSSISSMEPSDRAKHKAIDDRLSQLSSGFDDVFKATSRDIVKKGFSGTGVMLLTTTISKTIMSKMLLKIGAKSAGKVATFAAGSTTGLGICAPTGPWALLCGVVTGTASWIGVDAALTEVDQAFNQESFQLSTSRMIDAEKKTLKALIKDSYRVWILQIFTELKQSSRSPKSPYEQMKG